MSAPLWIPGAVHELIPQTSTDPDIIPIGDIFHVAVSESTDLHDFFSHDGGIESTGYILRDGTIKQYRPLNVECDAQFDGNSWVAADGKRYGFNSWETQGMGTGEWTPEQVASIKKIIDFKHQTYGIPKHQCPDWDKPGFGYHSLFDRWNKSHHTCPGPDRVRQWENVIVPWLAQAAPSPAPQRDPAPAPAANKLADAVVALAKEHNVSLVTLARCVLFEARKHNKGGRLARIVIAAKALVGMK